MIPSSARQESEPPSATRRAWSLPSVVTSEIRLQRMRSRADRVDHASSSAVTTRATHCVHQTAPLHFGIDPAADTCVVSAWPFDGRARETTARAAAGQPPAGHATTGQATAGQATAGQATTGQATAGQATVRSRRPRADLRKPTAGKPIATGPTARKQTAPSRRPESRPPQCQRQAASSRPPAAATFRLGPNPRHRSPAAPCSAPRRPSFPISPHPSERQSVEWLQILQKPQTWNASAIARSSGVP